MLLPVANPIVTTHGNTHCHYLLPRCQSHCYYPLLLPIANTAATQSVSGVITPKSTTPEIHQGSDNTIHNYIARCLPGRRPNKFHKPFPLACFLFSHDDNVLIQNRKISVLNLIDHMVETGVVPFQRNAIYKLVRRFEDDKLDASVTWTRLSKKGIKSLLSSDVFAQLITTLREDTSGGRGMSFPQVRDRIKESILNHWRLTNKSVVLPCVPIDTLNTYASIIYAQDVFNLERYLQPKTESRAAAEWSIRSTISYIMTVAVTHFIALSKPSPYHPKKNKELNKEAVKLWNLAEKSYNKTIGNEGCSIALLPILPNLITSTDEVTIFATSSIINNKESSYLVAKPTEAKNEYCNSSNKNNYTNKEVGGLPLSRRPNRHKLYFYCWWPLCTSVCGNVQTNT